MVRECLMFLCRRFRAFSMLAMAEAVEPAEAAAEVVVWNANPWPDCRQPRSSTLIIR